jgi:hypothetical protein
MKTGSSLGDPFIDCGAICMGPRQMLGYQRLIDDAVSKGINFIDFIGAKILSGIHTLYIFIYLHYQYFSYILYVYEYIYIYVIYFFCRS